MDPLSALGIAAAVAQFVQFGGSLVSKSRQIYTNGAVRDQIECEGATTRLAELTGNIKSSLKDLESLGNPSSDAKALGAICDNCIRLSAELLLRLETLRVDENYRHRKWKSFRQALKSVCFKNGVDSLARELAACGDELNSYLIAFIRCVCPMAPQVLNIY
jgi:hypothetical protein